MLRNEHLWTMYCCGGICRYSSHHELTGYPGRLLGRRPFWTIVHRMQRRAPWWLCSRGAILATEPSKEQKCRHCDPIYFHWYTKHCELLCRTNKKKGMATNKAQDCLVQELEEECYLLANRLNILYCVNKYIVGLKLHLPKYLCF